MVSIWKPGLNKSLLFDCIWFNFVHIDFFPYTGMDYSFNLDDNEGVCDLFDVQILNYWWLTTVDSHHREAPYASLKIIQWCIFPVFFWGGFFLFTVAIILLSYLKPFKTKTSFLNFNLQLHVYITIGYYVYTEFLIIYIVNINNIPEQWSMDISRDKSLRLLLHFLKYTSLYSSTCSGKPGTWRQLLYFLFEQFMLCQCFTSVDS